MRKEVIPTPIEKGLLGLDDHLRFGHLVADLERLGAYMIQYIPKRSAVLAWFRPKDKDKAEEYLRKRGAKYTVKAGRNGNFYLFEVWW